MVWIGPGIYSIHLIEIRRNKSTGISLTPAGKVFYEEQTKLMNSQFRLLEKMKSFRQDYAGTLNIGIREDLSYDLILRTAMYVKSVHPNLSLRTALMTWPNGI